MQELKNLKFSNQFATLPEELFHRQTWTPFDAPKLIHYNDELAKTLSLPRDLNPEDLVPFVNGNKVFKNSAPLSWPMQAINLVLGFLNLEMAEVFY